MNLLDLLPFVLIIGYGVLGFFTGLLHRFIGLVALFLAFLAATAMGLQAGGILQQTSNFEIPDARIYGFFGILVVVIVVIDGAAWLAKGQIKLEAIVFNRPIGVVVGVVTAFLLSVVVVHELEAAGNPFGGPQLDSLESSIRSAVNGSHVAVPVTNKIGTPFIDLFQPFLPSDPQIYFSSSPVSP
jgi:uncharacterized membrane protein required for colicin V production